MLTVGYSSPFVPPEWIAAHGLRPRRLVPRGTDGFVAAGVCPFAAAMVPCAAGVDAAVLTSTCDQMRRMAERLLIDASRVFLMNVPATWQTPAAVELYAEELRRLGRLLVRLGGSAPDREALARAMRQYDEARQRLRDAPVPDGRVRLALLGSPLRQADQWLHECIDRAGACVALDATEYGHRGLPARFDQRALADDPFAQLVRAYFLTIPDAFRRPDTLLHEYLRANIAARRIQGVVLVRYLWCDQWHAQLQRLKEGLRIPVIEIDLAGRDHQLQRTRTRIESLVSILQ